MPRARKKRVPRASRVVSPERVEAMITSTFTLGWSIAVSITGGHVACRRRDCRSAERCRFDTGGRCFGETPAALEDMILGMTLFYYLATRPGPSIIRDPARWAGVLDQLPPTPRDDADPAPA